MPFFSTIEEAQEYDRDQREYREMCAKLHNKYLCQDLGIRTHVTVRPETKDYIFTTINPPPSLDLPQFLKTIDKMVAKPWVDSYIYVIEQRGLPDINIGYGFHTHILLHLNRHVKPSIINRELKNTWRTKLDVENFHILNIKHIDDKEQKKVQNYMLNWKDDESKHPKQYGDDIFRKDNSLPRYYTFNYKLTADLRTTYYD